MLLSGMAMTVCLARPALAFAGSSLRGAIRSSTPRARSASAVRSLVAPDDSGGKPQLAKLRRGMELAGIEALVVPPSDPHLSEYVAPAYERRAFLSRFTGSAGTALVTKDEALLWTDGRYFLQAEQQLGPDWALMRANTPGVPTLEEWAADNLADGARCGVDAFTVSVEEAERLSTALGSRNRELALVPLPDGANLVDEVWCSPPEGCAPRPPLPRAPARSLGLDVAGVSRADKLARLAREVRKAGGDAFVAGALDEVCWLLNLRGEDVPNCPVLQGYVIVDAGRGAEARPPATLFVDAGKIDTELRSELAASNVGLAEYGEVEAAVRSLAAQGRRLMFDASAVNFAIGKAAGERAVRAPSPLGLPKAMKNEAELAGMREAHLRDGAALASFFAWIEAAVARGGGRLSEVELVRKLRSFREAAPGFIGPSFDTIAGFGPNGAIIHYNPAAAPPETVRTLDGAAPELVLLDSGAQFDCGTTDVTRTFHLGEPSVWQRECFTRVLQGHIALDRAVFPEGTPGMAIDAFARAPLWKAGLDYRHGTGHGVGAALNVHEGPQSISARYGNTAGLRDGMIVSNEPGYYEEGGFGIRIENLLVARPRHDAASGSFGGTTFLGFEQLTQVPIQLKMLAPELMSAAELAWLDEYHALVWSEVSARLEEDSDARRWLRRATRPVHEQSDAARGAGGLRAVRGFC